MKARPIFWVPAALAVALLAALLSYSAYIGSGFNEYKAREAIVEWADPKWRMIKVSVVGVREKPDMGGSRLVDFTILNFGFNSNGRDVAYNGPGIASFKVYTNGKCKLEHIELTGDPKGSFRVP